MFIERIEDCDKLISKLELEDSIVIPIFESSKLHTYDNNLSFLFIRFLNDESWSVVSRNHYDIIYNESIFKNILNKLINLKNNYSFILNKKYLINYLNKNKLEYNTNNLIDINLIAFFKNLNLISNWNIPYNFTKFKLDNNLFPIVKWIPELIKISDSIKKILDKKIILDPTFEIYNNSIIDIISNLESNGIYVSEEFFKEVPKFKSTSNIIYQDINFYNKTGRLSSTFSGFNFFAINKKENYAKHLVSRWGKDGKLISIDYRAFHLYLIGELVGYKFSDYPYLEFAKKLLAKSDPTPEQIKSIKPLVFKNLYGHSSELKELEFFKKLNEFVNELYKNYKSSLGLYTKVLGRNINGLPDDPRSILNWYLQGYEFETTIIIIERVLSHLAHSKSHLILTLYDSFIFDWYIPDGKELLEEIVNIIKDNRFEVSFKNADSYNNL